MFILELDGNFEYMKLCGSNMCRCESDQKWIGKTLYDWL